jgi:hypothetical protein
MTHTRKALLFTALLAMAACSNDVAAPTHAIPGAGAERATYATLDQEIQALIQTLFPNNGLVTAAGDRWEGVKYQLSIGKVDVARRTLTNLSTWVSQRSLASRKADAARLILDMALYVYNGPGTPVPGNGSLVQTAAGVVEPNTSLTLTTAHADGSVGDGGIHIDVGSVATTTIAVISEVTGDFTKHCSGPLNYRGCQEPKFFRITLFPHEKLLQPAQVQICHVTQGELRRPLGDHDDLRVAHEKPANQTLYTPGGTIVDGIEILPYNGSINFLTAAGHCNTSYNNAPPQVIGFFDKLLGPDTRLGQLASTIGAALTPKSLYALDLGGGGMFLSESIFGLVNPNIMLTDGCINDCPNPVLALKEAVSTQSGTTFNLTVTNRSSYPDAMFASSPSLPPCGLNTSASRTWVDIYDGVTNARIYGFCALSAAEQLNNIWFFAPAAGPFPTSVYIKMTDRLTGLVYGSNILSVVPAPPAITSLTLASTEVVLDGPGTSYTAVMQNGGANHSNVDLQGYLVQGTVNGAAGGVVAQCGAGNGVLTTGTCTQSFTVNANPNNVPGLALGPATFRLELRENGVVLDSREIPVTIVSGVPTITSLTLASTDIQLDAGPVGQFTAVMENRGFSRSNIVLQGYLVQGSVTAPSGGVVALCSAGNGVLPTGTCSEQFSINAKSSAGLTTGAATFRLELTENGTLLDSRTAAVNITSAPDGTLRIQLAPLTK